MADSSDDFINSKNIDKDSFALAIIWGLLGDKYFIEGIHIGLVSLSDYVSLPAVSPPLWNTMNFSATTLPELSEDSLKKSIQNELDSQKSPISCDMVLTASKKYGGPIEYIMSFMKNDSSYWTKGLWAKTYNPGNVGNTDSRWIRNYLYKNLKGW